MKSNKSFVLLLLSYLISSVLCNEAYASWQSGSQSLPGPEKSFPPPQKSKKPWYRTQKNQNRIDERLTQDPAPVGIDGRCSPTCIKTICDKNFQANALHDAIGWCKKNCANSQDARQKIISNDYPANVCKDIPPYDPDPRRWYQEWSRYQSGDSRHTKAMEERGLTSSSPTGFVKRTQVAFNRLKEGGLSKLNCDFCKDPKQVCEDSGNDPKKIADNRSLCIERCWTAKWLRDITTFNPQALESRRQEIPEQYDLQENDSEVANLQENMIIYIKGVCAGKHSLMQELNQKVSLRGWQDTESTDDLSKQQREGYKKQGPTQHQSPPKFGYPMPPPQGYPPQQQPQQNPYPPQPQGWGPPPPQYPPPYGRGY